MDHYITGTTIKALRERQHLTQSQLAEMLCISDKAVSKWETGRGLPDLSLIEPLAGALRVSVAELFQGALITNQNRSANLLRAKIYVCPICGNVLYAAGETVISCCGVSLPPLEAEQEEEAHRLNVELLEHEYYVTLEHSMTKTHFISFVAYVTGSRFEYVKLYPEGSAEARFFRRGHGILYWYCNRHGLFCKRV